MVDPLPFDEEKTHRYFSAHCFNAAWELIDKTERSPEENEAMIRLAQASLWHWSQRPDCNEEKLSIGYWQAARVYALIPEADNARKYARLCLDITPTDRPFYLGYAYEALARAEQAAGNPERAAEHLQQARRYAEQVEDAEQKQGLAKDLESIQP